MTGRVEKILSSRQVSGGLTEYHIKWTGQAYIHCEWISEHRLQRCAAVKLKNWLKKGHEDDSYENGVAVEWTQPERIVEAVGGKFRVKWKQLDYAEATLESREDIENFQQLYDDFLRRSNWNAYLKEMKEFAAASKGKKFERLEKQPRSLKVCHLN